MNLPAKYAYLADEGAPQLLVQALKLYGVTEVPGPKSSPTIMGWLKKLAFSWIKDDATPWCGTSMGYAAVEAGVAVRHPEMPRAFWWAGWGLPSPVPMLGDVLVFNISHVGIYVGEDATHFHVLGGNQGDAYCIARFPKKWLKCARRTAWRVAQPPNVRRIWLAGEGGATAPTTR